MRSRPICLLTAGTLLAGLASAQPDAGRAGDAVGCGPPPGAGIGGPPVDCPPDLVGAGHAPGTDRRSRPEGLPGWPLMSPQEQQLHRDRLRALQTYQECRDYMDQHHDQMVARALAGGVVPPDQPAPDTCAGLAGAPR